MIPDYLRIGGAIIYLTDGAAWLKFPIKEIGHAHTRAFERTDDCVKIAQHLHYLYVFPDESAEERKTYAPILAASWRYKPDAP